MSFFGQVWRHVRDDPKDAIQEAAEIAGSEAFPGGGVAVRLGFVGFDRFRGATMIRTRKEHYVNGAKLLRKAKKSIVVLSTLEKEQVPGSDIGSLPQELRDYFIELHKLAYANTVRPASERVRLTRYADLACEPKCEEAISLLYYGADVEIFNARLPVEFLLVDNKSIMIGFPDKEGRLSSGFLRKKDTMLSEHMNEWVRTFVTESDTNGYASREMLKEFKTSPQHSNDCLCKLIQLFDKGVPDPKEASFDKIHEWYSALYDPTSEHTHYRALNDFFRELMPPTPGTRPNFLDCGCGIGFGAQVLSQTFNYWGIEKSARMLEHALKGSNRTFVEGDFFDMLMTDLKNPLPQHFSVIACQGNTFDHLLGRVQKALALYLFDQHLEPGGILMFTGARFDPTMINVPRRLHAAGHTEEIFYKRDPSGNFCRMSVPGNNASDPQSRVDLFTHHIGDAWLSRMMISLGYKAVRHNLNPWIVPGSSEAYNVLLFQKPHP